MKPIRTRGGRQLSAIGDATLLTMERLATISDHFDAEPRVATVSLVAAPTKSQDGEFLRATGPAGPVTVVALDLSDVLGDLATDDPDPEKVDAWLLAASEHGLWHDWLFATQPDVTRATLVCPPSAMDAREVQDPSGSHHAALINSEPVPERLTITIDATWLGPHETGAQVLTTAAIAALARNERIASIALTGIGELPTYAQHLTAEKKVSIATNTPAIADVVWYPNQIDQRSNIGAARALGKRVVTTYLDLIAYDIPRYHASDDAWAAYRALQRTIALSVDGITTISADVAQRLMQEVPRLDPKRVLPIPLGLDHIAACSTATTPDDDISALAKEIDGKQFLLVLGNDFKHKNRDFAIAVWEKILDSGVNCDLVLAGLHVRSSSSKDAEDDLLSRHTNLRGTAHTVGHVSSASREWLLANAAAVIYPSSAEGFGFVPYEAAVLHTPSTFTAFGPLLEISGLTDVPRTWSTDAYAADLVALLTSEEKSDARITHLHRAIDAHTWDGFATTLVDFFFTIRTMPTVTALPNTSAEESAALAAVLSSKTWRAAEKLRGIGSKLRRN